MKIKCDDCGFEQRGRFWKLKKYGWEIIFISEGTKVCKCSFCKLNREKMKESVQKKLDKIMIMNRLDEFRYYKPVNRKAILFSQGKVNPSRKG